jgi:hypothetical protein
MKKNVKSSEPTIPSFDFVYEDGEQKEPRLLRCAICGEAVELKGKGKGDTLGGRKQGFHHEQRADDLQLCERPS